jgi:hypothetical protein
MTRYPAITLVSGILLCGSYYVPLIGAEVPLEELPWLFPGFVFLVSPYVVLAALAVVPGGIKPLVWAVVLAILLATTGAGMAFVLSSTSSTAGLLFTWLVPLQLAIAGATALPPFRRKREQSSPRAGLAGARAATGGLPGPEQPDVGGMSRKGD